MKKQNCKVLYTALVFSFVVGLMFGAISLCHANPDYLGSTDYGDWFIQLGNQGVTKQGTVYQEVYTIIRLFNANLDGSTIEKTLYLIDCIGKRYTAVVTGNYDREGNLIGELITTTIIEWSDIKPDSIADAMRIKACGVPI